MAIELKPLSPIVGVEMTGLDPRSPDNLTLRNLQQAFLHHHMVLLRAPDLSEGDCIKLTEAIGSAQVRVKNAYDTDKTMLISNVHKGGHIGNGELLFHSDGMFLEAPLKAISLYALSVPSKGGETKFANAMMAYDLLPETLRKRIAGLQGRHVWAYNEYGDTRPNPDDFKPGMKHAIHPLAWRNAVTGKMVLMASKMFTDCIMGVDRAESDEILGEIFACMENPSVVYWHKWQVGDYLVWDNRVLQHARADFDPSEPRAMRRVPIVDSEMPVLN
jgi:taurine dioxygenase